jgi:hypothetical protein
VAHGYPEAHFIRPYPQPVDPRKSPEPNGKFLRDMLGGRPRKPRYGLLAHLDQVIVGKAESCNVETAIVTV